MNDAISLNKTCKQKYENDPTEANLISYVMSELLSPIEDFFHVMDLIESRIDDIKDDRLLFLASALSTDWRIGVPNVFLEKLNEKTDSLSDDEKAIVYYLNAYDLNAPGKTKTDMRQYRELLERSISCSDGMRFANNRLLFAKISDAQSANALIRSAKDNIVSIRTVEESIRLPDDHWFDIQHWIDERILGITLSSSVFNEIYRKR